MYCWRARISYGFRAGVNEKENGKRRRIFMKTVTKFCLKMVQNYLPDAFILAILLTFVVFCGGMFLMNKSALQMIEYWGRGYSSMFVFGMHRKAHDRNGRLHHLDALLRQERAGVHRRQAGDGYRHRRKSRHSQRPCLQRRHHPRGICEIRYKGKRCR